MKVNYDSYEDCFWFHAGPRDTERMKLMPGARYIRSQQAWKVDANRAAVETAGYLFRQGELEPDDDTASRIAHLRLPHHMNAITFDGSRLRPYQSAAVAFLKGHSALVADEMGTGKTPTAIRAMPDSGHVLVVCPKSLMYNWHDEVLEWSWRTPYVVDGNITKRRKTLVEAAEDPAAVIIINFEGLKAHTRLLGYGNAVKVTEKEAEPKELNEFSFACMVVDECHKIKEPKAKTTRAVWALRRQADHAWALTGTPLVNDADDVWSIMHYVAPKEWPVRSQYRNLFCDVRPGWFGGIENHGIRPHMLELFDTIFQPRYIRRLKRDVLPDLPEKTHTVMKLPMSAKQAKAYKQMKEEMIASLDGELLIATDPLVQAMRLREIASAVPEMDGDFNIVGLEAPSNKLDAIIDIKEQTDGPIVVFAESARLVRMLNAELEQAGYKTAAIWQDVSARARQDFVESFQAGELDMIVLTTGTGAEGITLTRSDTLVFAQQSWSNAKNLQAEDRIHRIGQDRGTNIITLISEGTIDERTFKVAAEKASNLEQIVRDQISEELS